MTHTILWTKDDPWSPLELDHAAPFVLGGCKPATIAAPASILRRKSISPAMNDDPETAALFDQFYTRYEVAEDLYEEVRDYLRRSFGEGYADRFLMVEPSAGQGAFFVPMPSGSIGVDLASQCKGVLATNFLTLQIISNRRVVIVGNPPFGTGSEKALEFVNHAARQADFIAFILPATFRKTRIINRIDETLHLVSEHTVPKKAFLFLGKPREVPTVFQIWERRNYRRPPLPEVTNHPDFRYTSANVADFAIQRIGADAGRVHNKFGLSDNSHYFISAHPGGKVERIMRELQPAFAKVAKNTAGTPSLAKSEIFSLYLERVSRNSWRRRRAIQRW
ncbi:MAG: SAM-dependent methyltransferase [Sphingomonas sp.]